MCICEVKAGTERSDVITWYGGEVGSGRDITLHIHGWIIELSEEEEAEQCLWEWGRAAPFVLARMGGRKEDAESHGIYISFTWDSISKSFSMVLMITFFFSLSLSLSSGLKKMSKE